MSTREQREDWKSLADTWSEMITTGVNRLPAREWWAAVFPMGLEVATAMPALLADVERLEAERDEAREELERWRVALYRTRSAKAQLWATERVLRAWVARAVEAMEGVTEHNSACEDGPGMYAGCYECTCYVSALRAVLADAPKEKP